MATSQNGWSVDPNRVTIAAGGVGFPGGVRAGDVAVVLGYVATEFNERVEQLIPGHCWGYASRPIRGQSTGYSNHASATAIDVNAPEHPRGSRGTFTKAEVATIHAILGELGDNVVRWGGDYTSGPVDEMHFEINANAARVAAAAKRLTQKGMTMDAEVKKAFAEVNKENANTQGRVTALAADVANVRHYTDAKASEILAVVRAMALKSGVPQAELDRIQKSATS